MYHVYSSDRFGGSLAPMARHKIPKISAVHPLFSLISSFSHSFLLPSPPSLRLHTIFVPHLLAFLPSCASRRYPALSTTWTTSPWKLPSNLRCLMRNTPLHDNLPSNPLSSNARAIDPVGGLPQSSSSIASFGARRGSSTHSTQERLYRPDPDRHDESDDEGDNEEEDEEDEDDGASSETRPVLAKTVASKRSVLSHGKAHV